MTESRFRWIGRPSEEELLGLPFNGTRRANGFHATPPAPLVQGAPAIVAEPPRRRFGVRILVVVAAVGTAVGLALEVAHRGLRSESPGPVVPTVAASSVARTVAPDRERRSVPRERAKTGAKRREQVAVTPQGETAQEPSENDSGGSKDEDDPKPPPTETSDPPLLEANVPGVGTLTIEEPNLPDADEVLRETSTLSVP